MKYRIDEKSGNKLSALGFGCMRFSRGINTKIDIDKAEKLVMSAIDRGVNYFDTGYVYAGSEQALGEILRRNEGARAKIHIATKLPYNQCKTYEDFDKIFKIQLGRLHTDRIDYYLMHNMTCVEDWDRIRKLGIEEWIAAKKAEGSIGQIGFSFHGLQHEFMALLEAYGWDFCMIQYNYVNENYQAGREGLLKAHEKGLPVIVMEPLLGGKLAAGLPKKVIKLFNDADSGLTPAARSLRWLWNHEEVTVVLSGMNSMEQLDDNIHTAQTAEPGMLTQSESEVIARAAGIFREAYRIPCTECNYCLPCPKGVNIPGSFAAYNMSYVSGYIAGMTLYMTSTRGIDPEKSTGGRKCVKCGICSKRCPQNIDVIAALEKVLRRMEPFWLNAGIKLARKFMK